MCVGLPMQAIECWPGGALCRARDGDHCIDTSLIGEVEPGTWLMVFLGAAREVLSPQEAKRSADALEALEMAMRGETGFDHLFADLVGREPQLPPYLRPGRKQQS
jgi:hydrogenase expression/formation protein HypC